MADEVYSWKSPRGGYVLHLVKGSESKAVCGYEPTIGWFIHPVIPPKYCRRCGDRFAAKNDLGKIDDPTRR